MSVQTIPLSDIIISEGRQRREFQPDALLELSNAIQEGGLMHAIVVRETPQGFVLVAGERRMRAIKDMWMLGGQLRYNGYDIPEGRVPYVTLGDLSPLEAEEAELSENLHRKDLTWQETAAAQARLHSLRSKQAQAEGRIHTAADTAKELTGRSDGSYQAAVRTNLIVAKHLDNPDIAKAKTAAEAVKILKRQEISQKNIQLAHEVGKTFTQSVHEVHNVDCLKWMQATEPNQFDVILTDPPYGMGADTFRDAGGAQVVTHEYKDDYETFQNLMRQWCALAFRVAKPEAHAYLFCDIDNYHELKRMMQTAGWYVFRTPMILVKPDGNRVPWPDCGPRRNWECILYAIKGKKKTTAIYPDVVTAYGDPGILHGAQKPVAAYRDLLRRSVRPGDTILDSFAGSGTIFPAAHEMKCKAVGLELSPEYYGLCLTRIQGLDAAAAVATKTTELTSRQLLGELDAMLNK